MPVGNAWKYAPARQARLQADMQNPEWLRRRAIWKVTKNPHKRKALTLWNIAWNLAGRPADFPDFDAWFAANPPTDYLTGKPMEKRWGAAIARARGERT